MADAETQANVNGEGAVLLTVRRQSGTNTVQVVDEVRARLAEVAPLAPKGYSIRIVRDMSEFIKASMRSVEEHLIVGSIPRRWSSSCSSGTGVTIIAAIAIPTSIIATFGLIWHQGFAEFDDDARPHARRGSSSTTRSSCSRTSIASSKSRAGRPCRQRSRQRARSGWPCWRRLSRSSPSCSCRLYGRHRRVHDELRADDVVSRSWCRCSSVSH